LRVLSREVIKISYFGDHYHNPHKKKFFLIFLSEKIVKD
jgi:hypothetical protein